MRFGGVCFITDDVSRLVSFYERLFGTKATGDHNHAELSACGVKVAFFTRSGMESLAPGSMSGAGNGAITLNFEVSDIESEYRRVCQMGAQIIKPLQTHPWGAKSFWFRDPDRNILSFYQMV